MADCDRNDKAIVTSMRTRVRGAVNRFYGRGNAPTGLVPALMEALWPFVKGELDAEAQLRIKFQDSGGDGPDDAGRTESGV